jgi:hypothetical protein
MRNAALGIVFLAVVAASCKTDKVEFQKHERLAEFRSWTVMGMDDLARASEQTYLQIESEQFNPETDTILYNNNSIYISCLSIVNGCGRYSGDIQMRSDSIFLNLVTVVEFACARERCDRLVYKIDNPENRKYKIIKWR